MTMSLTDLPTNDGRTMTNDQPGPRNDRPRRRTFSAAYKLRILDAYEQATAPGQRGALLRREGLYHSHIKDWKRAQETGTLNALTPKRTGPTPKTTADKETERLTRENERLKAELDKTKKSLHILGKAHELLELLSESTDSNTEPEK